MSLSVQWGVIPANVGVVTWIYPIKFTSVYSLVTTRYAAYFDSLTQYSDKEMALCYINVDKCRINRGNETTERIYVIAIGQAQQWGLYDFPGSNGDKVYFPVAFAVMCAAAIVQPAGRNSHEVTNRTTTYIQGDFRYGDSYKLGTWLAVGY